MIFPLFWLLLISSSCLNYVKPIFLSSVNKCTIMIIIINAKIFLERYFLPDFN